MPDKKETEKEEAKIVHDLGDVTVVRDLLRMAGQEVLYRVVQVSRRIMQADKARDMDDALARHIARALMGENPEFKGVAGWNGMPCAQAFAAVNPELFAEVKSGEQTVDTTNPRVLMVLAATAFYKDLYRTIEKSVEKEGATPETVKAEIDSVADRYALAVVPAAKN